jgi:hypothetical protein
MNPQKHAIVILPDPCEGAIPMPGRLMLTALLPLLLLATPASAATKEQKMETCKFGADNDKLTGAKRDAFIKRCMANANYEPAARKDALKKTVTKKKPAPKPAAPMQQAPEPESEPEPK